eukprot:CAMPEP_0118675486 /NCGR_PEP_ID=MMETSP0800-20121206/1477_1 /TAXON_ID=210618 ORGANISM="Striatella unipunctata, Strain CCMP2910" /NCGR_SAMPLE_ID=MMETSP0800 /ASSEMBLY_ACC=CAM_ASM_000638 /LENGTH=50 /DNA_ID=CAMNT_0006570811 /DNA_START=62 /DNA_END=214 /DNA_ORIENTATION=-
MSSISGLEWEAPPLPMSKNAKEFELKNEYKQWRSQSLYAKKIFTEKQNEL